MSASRTAVVILLGSALLSAQAALRVASARRVPWFDYGAALAPDGESILFSSGQGVQIQNLATGKTQPVLPLLEGARDFSFSPDGKSIYYTRPIPEKTWVSEAYNLVLSSGERRKILSGTCCMVLSPDGGHLAYIRRSAGNAPITLFISRTNGREEREIGAFQRVNLHGWSADGQSLLLGGWGSDRQSLRIVSVQNGEAKTLVAGDEYVAWSRWPHGAGGIYMLRFDLKSKKRIPSSQVWYFSVPGGAWTQVTNEADAFSVLLNANKDGTILAALRRVDLGTFWDGMMDMFGVPNGNPDRFQTELVLLKR